MHLKIEQSHKNISVSCGSAVVFNGEWHSERNEIWVAYF